MIDFDRIMQAPAWYDMGVILADWRPIPPGRTFCLGVNPWKVLAIHLVVFSSHYQPISGRRGRLLGSFDLIGAGQETLSGVDRSQRLRNSRRIHVARFSGPGDHSRPISCHFC